MAPVASRRSEEVGHQGSLLEVAGIQGLGMVVGGIVEGGCIEVEEGIE